VKARAVRFTPEAAAQAEAADRWWRQNRAGSADLFANELSSAVDLVARAPGAGRGYLSEALPGARRVPLHRTRFHIYYAQREDVIDSWLLATRANRWLARKARAYSPTTSLSVMRPKRTA